MAFVLSSSAFPGNGEIPTEHTCEGADVSPPLSWSGVPEGTRSFALIVDDPDAPDPKAPKTTWVHWVVYRIPANVTQLAAKSTAASLQKLGIRVGRNDWKRAEWGGPCPPIGRHRYFHKLFALDTELADLGEPTKAELEKAMQGHVLGQATLVGTYEKAKSRR